MEIESLVALDPAWPRRALADATAALTAPGGRFEIETVEVRGRPTRVWKQAPPTLASLIAASRAHGERAFTIYEDERVSYDAISAPSRRSRTNSSRGASRRATASRWRCAICPNGR